MDRQQAQVSVNEVILKTEPRSLVFFISFRSYLLLVSIRDPYVSDPVLLFS